ncbi:MAG: flagellar assembly protein FliW [Candidatus Auribacterota bacterium]|jgi:flagellar assembly factor FliW|uniref:Flagellar assembly factor FliW n=1 Tax=Candidatus Auribacter fodinae TaxID=2093366 RepID=A0A3A4R944_9BACT|nr:MAG: flagellar assembly protein FliW [Candidatus Auribacter fodinae]
MNIKTTRFGDLEIDERTIITFPEGIIGFEKHKRFVILTKKTNAPLRWLQSVEEPRLAFIIINPFLFKSDYQPAIDGKDLSLLRLKSLEEAEILTIVVVPDNPRDMVANLMAPIVINPELCLAKQVIINDTSYPTRYRILDSYDKNPDAARAVSC